ncbi:TlpA family protein disulfide reductase [bacterium]|nr:TlpA family protein disulfide reductase [bacterium]
MRKLLILFLGILLVSCSATEKKNLKKAPDFSLKTPDNKIVKLSDYKGKVVILNFFGTWCPPCRMEIPDFVKFYKENKEKGVVIIGIAVGSRPEDIKKMIKEFKINYPVCISDGKVEREYGGIRFVPTSFIIDKNGNIYKKQIGMMNKGQLEEIFKKLK